MDIDINKQLVCSTAHVHPNVAGILDAYARAKALQYEGNLPDVKCMELFILFLRLDATNLPGDTFGRVMDFLHSTMTLSGLLTPECGWRFRVPQPDDDTEGLPHYRKQLAGCVDTSGRLHDFSSLLDVLELAEANDCLYVQFDRDAKIIPTIPHHDW